MDLLLETNYFLITFYKFKLNKLKKSSKKP
jgi:hypothetical protein